MIQLQKGPIPATLLVNGESWKRALLDAIAAADDDRKRDAEANYRHAEIKDQIVLENYGKCCYCESYIRASSPGDIEHIIPKSKAPELTFEWTNLTLVCSRCNSKKHSYHVPAFPLINPYVDCPEEHLIFASAYIHPVPGSDKGELTVKKIGLNRTELLERRLVRICAIDKLTDRWARLQPGPIKDIALSELKDETNPDKDYSASVVAHLLLARVPL